MKCLDCSSSDTSVIEKRNIKGIVRRRRKCNACPRRFTTYEIYKELYKVKLQKKKLKLVKRNKKGRLIEKRQQEQKQSGASKRAQEFMKKFGIGKLKG